MHADTEHQLADEVAAVRSLAASLLLDARPTTYRALHGWTTTLPLGMDGIRMRRTFDTDALAAAFPFTSPDLPARRPRPRVRGARPGCCTATTSARRVGALGPVRPGMHNHNSVILARSGAGQVLPGQTRTAALACYRGIDAAVIDPEDEYTRLAAAVGGTASSTSAAPGSGSTRSTCPCTPIPTGAAPPPAMP